MSRQIAFRTSRLLNNVSKTTLKQIESQNRLARFLTTSSLNSAPTGRLDVDVSEDKSWRRFLKKPDILGVERFKMKEAAYRLYLCCTDGVDQPPFFTHFELEDTFNSWFLITELHIWMMATRMMQEGKKGRKLRYDLVEAMWKDVEKRSKVLGPSVGSSRKEQITEMAEQFQASLFAYDEGLLMTDVILASALWRRFLQQSSDDANKIEILVSYVRRSIQKLDMIDPDLLFSKGEMKWPLLLEKNRL